MTQAITSMTYQMEEAAELLAMGKYKSHVAKRLNVNAATLWKWMQEPEFIAYANAVRDGLRETTVMEIAATIKEALAIDSDVLAGTMPADDPRAIRAADITRHAYRAWAVQPKPDEWADGRTERHYRR